MSITLRRLPAAGRPQIAPSRAERRAGDGEADFSRRFLPAGRAAAAGRAPGRVSPPGWG